MRGPRWAFAAALLLLTAPVAGGETLTLDQAALEPVGDGVLAARISLPPAQPDTPVIAPGATDPGAVLVRRLAALGRAGGLGGVLYDNRDRGHSELRPDLFPQLTRIVYGPALQAAGADFGLAGGIVFPVPVLGNSSTALTRNVAWRSLPRLAMTQAGGPDRSFALYAANALYVYPEHRDHDAFDMFPANWPYTVTSQGSSSSDRPFLRALAMTLAAFPPETRARLEARKLIAPTLQMILRRSLRPVLSDAAYFTGLAHPVVFDASDLVPGRMVTLASTLTPDTIPPLVRIDIADEDFTDAAGPGGLSERLFDTPSAVARIWRGPEARHALTVSASRTFDPNGRPLHFTWALLTGDPDRVRITPFGSDDAQARIELDWQDPAVGAVPGRPPGARIDIGVFASNGVQVSAPAIVSILLPLHEGRSYVTGPDGRPRLAGGEPRRDIPRDPVLFPRQKAGRP